MLTQPTDARPLRDFLLNNEPNKVAIGWAITKVISSSLDQDEIKNWGPRNTKFTREEIETKGVSFRMFDDDGELYYEGKFFDPSMESPDSLGEEAFKPLDDFARPNAGCTEIRYKNSKTNKWETL